MQKINPNLYPKSGFMFEESDGARIFGDTWPGVIARVRKYRQRAGMPPGDPEAEVTAYACNHNPGYCTEQTEAARLALRKASLKVRVLKFLAEAVEGLSKAPDGYAPWVDDQTAKERAAICAKCPLNQEIGSGCANCKAALKELRGKILKHRWVDRRLWGCEILGEDTAVMVHTTEVTTDNPELPAHCWRKRTL